MTNSNLLETEYVHNGLVKIKFSNDKAVFSLRKKLNDYLKNKFKLEIFDLDNLHEHFSCIDRTELSLELNELFWKTNTQRQLVIDNKSIFSQFVGPEIHVQEKPFLRFARPNIKEDNIGFHRDTDYGQLQYEITVHVPLTNLCDKACMQFARTSHLMPDSKIKRVTQPQENSSVIKGSEKHQIGYPYDPKVIADFDGLTPEPINIGEALVFPPSTVHGQTINSGQKTRFSFDFRIVSSFVAIDKFSNKKSRGYVPATVSAVTEVALKFAEINDRSKTKKNPQ
jgi:sporadic carbohydrate cluster 2OG-Fe(II) oxygenase